MNDEAAEERGQSGPPAAETSAPASAGPAPSDVPPAPPIQEPTWAGFTRDKLIRPRQGRYVAGLCAALARATNTDPVLWRVLFAVLGIMSGVGVLLYLVGWLVVPAEGDTASPIESLLGKGRSGMAPLSVVLLGAGAVLSFVFIVQDGMRAGLLAAAVVLGAILLIKRNGLGTSTPAPFSGAAPPPEPAPTGEQPTAAYAPPGFPAPPAAAPAEEPVTTPFATVPPAAATTATATLPPRPPASVYRPPFAPHGPYAGPTPPPYTPPPPFTPPPRPAKAPKPPRERSKLGRLTFFAVLMVTGVMALIDMSGASIAVSAYFAAALVTIALGLIVGAWVGRARGLIALALLTSLGLAVSTGVERFGGEVGNSVYRPQTVAAIADRYDFTAGNATLDLRDVDFTGQQQTVTATMKVGQLRVLLPSTVDTTATVDLKNGRAVILGHELDDHDISGQTVTDDGPDGAGGGTLKLDLQMDTGNLEVTR
jgi:phage shock protein PspC (stress-responsive transcriptional regulator)